MKDLISDVIDFVLWFVIWGVVAYFAVCVGVYCAAAAPPMSKQDEIATKAVALTILAEARGEGETGMYMVAAVIEQRSLNRKKSPLSVVREPKQFSCWNGVKTTYHDHLLNGSKEANYAWTLAYWIHQGYKTKQTYIDRKRYGYPDHYYNPDRANPSWKNKGLHKVVYKNHVFIRLKSNPVKLR